MIYWARWVSRLLLIIIVVLFERSMGLPVVTIILTSLYAGRLDRYWRWGLIMVIGAVLAVLFMIPFSISWLVISLSYIWSKHAKKILPSRVMRLILGSLVGSMVIVAFGFGQIYLSQLLYGAVAIFICVAWLKRQRFYLR